MYRAPGLAIWFAVALSLAVFGFNMLGDALRDLLDPRLKAGSGSSARPRLPRGLLWAILPPHTRSGLNP
jgi:peptide/nickel transport system permease protein